MLCFIQTIRVPHTDGKRRPEWIRSSRVNSQIFDGEEESNKQTNRKHLGSDNWRKWRAVLGKKTKVAGRFCYMMESRNNSKNKKRNDEDMLQQQRGNGNEEGNPNGNVRTTVCVCVEGRMFAFSVLNMINWNVRRSGRTTRGSYFVRRSFFFFVKFVVISPLVLHVTRASIGVAFSNDCRDSMADILDPSSTGSLDR